METSNIEQTFYFTASPAAVYAALTDAEMHAAVTGDEATGNPVPGGTFTAYGDYISGKYIELKRNEKIVHEWKTTEWPKAYPPSIVTITLEPSEKGTRLHMMQTDVPKSQAENYRKGWIAYYWEPMEEYFLDNKE